MKTAQALAKTAPASQLERAFRILQLLSGREGLSATELAQRCGVTRRTIFRDLKTLEAAGTGVYLHAESRRYRLRQAQVRARVKAKEGEGVLPAELTQEELLALVCLTGQLAASPGAPLQSWTPAQRAVEKLRGSLSCDALEELETMRRQMRFRVAEGEELRPGLRFYPLVEKAIRQRRILWCTYEAARSRAGESSGQGPLQSFDYKPYGIYWNKGACYVLGHHSGRDAIRTLRLSRFRGVELTDRNFRPPEGFSVQKFLGDAWGVMNEGKTQQVELLLTGLAAQMVEEMTWHPTQRTWCDPSGRLHFTCRVAGLLEISRWVLSMGGACQVLEPPELAQIVLNEAQQVVGKYKGVREHDDGGDASAGRRTGGRLSSSWLK